MVGRKTKLKKKELKKRKTKTRPYQWRILWGTGGQLPLRSL